MLPDDLPQDGKEAIPALKTLDFLKEDGERKGWSHNIRELHDMIAFWGGLNLNILHPNPAVAIICYRLNTKYKD